MVGHIGGSFFSAQTLLEKVDGRLERRRAGLEGLAAALIRADDHVKAALRTGMVRSGYNQSALVASDEGMSTAATLETTVQGRGEAVGVFEDERGGHVHPGLRVKAHVRLDANRVGAGDEARKGDGIHATVVNAAAAQRFSQADVAGIVDDEGHAGVNVAQSADLAGRDDFPETAALGMVHEDKGLKEQHFGLAASLDHLPALGRGDGEGFFAKDVFAGLGGFDGPLGVQRIGQRDVDCVDVRVVEQGLVTAQRHGNIVVAGKGVGGGLAATGYGMDLGSGRGAGRGDEGGDADSGGAEDAPFDGA